MIFFLDYEKPAFQENVPDTDQKRIYNFEQLPQFRGFDISILKFADESPETIIVGYILNDTAYEDIFSILCEEIYQTAEPEKNQKQMVQLLIERLLKWHQFP